MNVLFWYLISFDSNALPSVSFQIEMRSCSEKSIFWLLYLSSYCISVVRQPRHYFHILSPVFFSLFTVALTVLILDKTIYLTTLLFCVAHVLISSFLPQHSATLNSTFKLLQFLKRWLELLTNEISKLMDSLD